MASSSAGGSSGVGWGDEAAVPGPRASFTPAARQRAHRKHACPMPQSPLVIVTVPLGDLAMHLSLAVSFPTFFRAVEEQE